MVITSGRLFAAFVIAFGLMVEPVAQGQTPTHTPPAGQTCTNDRLVWVNTNSGVYHFQGERYYGSTKQGKFVCEKEALKEGDRATRNGQ
jgi:hypothetical protein